MKCPIRLRRVVCVPLGLLLLPLVAGEIDSAEKPPSTAADQFSETVLPIVKDYCLDCHSTKLKKGGLDLEQFASIGRVRRHLKAWQQVLAMAESGEMPPKKSRQPRDAERTKLVGWTRAFLKAEAHARAGDPGYVPLRRLSNAEYDRTILDLTGVDLAPTRQFPADGAGGEGFTNAAEALTDISPTLLSKYLTAAKEIAEHAVLLPEGFRFSPGKTRRDWTDESTARLRKFYADFAGPEGQLNVLPYLRAAVRRRQALLDGKVSVSEVARQGKLNAKYFGILWQALTSKARSEPLDSIRSHWRTAGESDVPVLAKEVADAQNTVWQTARIGSYIRPEGKRFAENLSRQVPVEPADWDLAQGYAEFRSVFPRFLCFPPVVPTDEVVSLKMFHREDEPLIRLFLDASAAAKLDRLWAEQILISRQPATENSYLPLFIGFVTQDQPKEMVEHFESQRPVFQKRADEFLKLEQSAIPKQLDALLEFAGRAYRHPLQPTEKSELLSLYNSIRAKGAAHDEAFRGVVARVLVSPAFLFRVEHAPPGKTAGLVDDWELASRVSYFLWSSMPDNELRQLAVQGRLADHDNLAGQVRRMLRDDKLRALAIEFGTQWIEVREFDQFNQKSEKLYPAFNDELRRAMYEEAILFFKDLFQNDRPVLDILDADFTYLNEVLAKHYGIPGVTGPAWRRVEGVKKFGRGGILGLACVQTRQAGAARTSPVLRGNWVVETLLGEKLPRPPANVPRLPEEEGNGGLTTRQQVEKHARDPACAVCHMRIDPFGFSFEKYDAIGRLRGNDSAGLPIDASAVLRDGTQFEGINGLRSYLLARKKEVIVRLFCRRLLGYALGRSVSLTDDELLDEMIAELNKNGGRISAAVMVITRSPQFRMIRGRDFED